jgi:hypothetical protein
MEVQLHTILTSALDGDGREIHVPAALATGEIVFGFE